MSRKLEPLDIPLPDKMTLALSPPTPPSALLLLAKVFLSLFAGYFFSLLFLVMLGFKGYTGTLEQFLLKKKALGHLIGLTSGMWILHRSVNLHFRRTAYFRALRGKELLIDPQGLKICKSFASRNGRKLERFRQTDTESPYFAILWDDVLSWNIKRIGGEAPATLVHRVTTIKGEVYDLDRYCMFGAEYFLLEYARRKVRCPILIDDPFFSDRASSKAG